VAGIVLNPAEASSVRFSLTLEQAVRIRSAGINRRYFFMRVA
jgi:hypothetical protein